MAEGFELDGVTYEFAEPSHISLRMYYMMRDDPAREHLDLSYANFDRLVDTFYGFAGKPEGSFMEHPEGLDILAVVIWLGMVKRRQDAGDYSYLPFHAALDANLGTFKILERMPGKAQPHKGRKRA